MSTSPWTDHARRELARAGYRTGGAREAVVDLLSRQECCLTAQEIHESLRAEGRSVGLASVYRALEALAGRHLVHRVTRDGTAAYEPAHPGGEHHHHLVCDSCGEMRAFTDETLERRIASVADAAGYSISAHDILLRGTCPDCR